MDRRTLDWLLRVWVLVSLAAGIGIIIVGVGTPIAVVGVLLIIVGIVSIMPAMQSYVGDWEIGLVE